MANNRRIAEHGAARAKAVAEATQSRLRDVMAAIEGEIEANGGIYPHCEGKVTASELIRRVGLSPAILQKDSHRAFNEKDVQSFLKRCRDRAGGKRSDVRKAVNEQVREKHEELIALMNTFALAELEHENRRLELIKAEHLIESLKAQITRMELELKQTEGRIRDLTARLTNDNVVSLRPLSAERVDTEQD